MDAVEKKNYREEEEREYLEKKWKCSEYNMKIQDIERIIQTTPLPFDMPMIVICYGPIECTLDQILDLPTSKMTDGSQGQGMSKKKENVNRRAIERIYTFMRSKVFKTKNWIPLALFLLTLSSTSAARFNLKECPSTQTSWKKRSQTFECKSHEAYHCILDKEGMLMEICMTPYPINPSIEGGCPSASPNKEDMYVLNGIFHPCEGLGCPQKNDPSYFTNEMYKYPRCLQALIDETTDLAITDTPVTESATVGELNNKFITLTPATVTVTVVVAFIFGFFLAFMCHLYRKKNASSWHIPLWMEKREQYPDVHTKESTEMKDKKSS